MDLCFTVVRVSSSGMRLVTWGDSSEACCVRHELNPVDVYMMGLLIVRVGVNHLNFSRQVASMKFNSIILLFALSLGISANLLFRDASSVQGLKRDGGNGRGQGSGNNQGEGAPKVAPKSSVKVTSTKTLISRSAATPEKSEVPEPAKSGKDLTNTELPKKSNSEKAEPTKTPELPKTKHHQSKVSGFQRPSHNSTRAHYTFHTLARPTGDGESSIARPTKSTPKVDETAVARPTQSVVIKVPVAVNISPIRQLVKRKC